MLKKLAEHKILPEVARRLKYFYILKYMIIYIISL